MDLTGLCAIKFEAPWCGPCKILNTNLKKIQAEFPLFTYHAVNVDDLPQLAKEYKIKNLPTVILLKDGKEITRIVGAPTIDPIRKIFREAMASQAA